MKRSNKCVVSIREKMCRENELKQRERRAILSAFTGKKPIADDWFYNAMKDHSDLSDGGKELMIVSKEVAKLGNYVRDSNILVRMSLLFIFIFVAIPLGAIKAVVSKILIAIGIIRS